MRGQPTIASMQGEFLNAENDLQMAAVDFQEAVTNSGNQSLAINDINGALTNLANITNDVTSTNIAAALGKKYKTAKTQIINRVSIAIKKANTALADISALSGKVETIYRPEDVIGPVTYSKRKAVIQAISATELEVLSGGLPLGKPLISNKNSGSSGFYNPGAEAAFQIDSAGCDEAPTITVENGSPFGSPIDTSSVFYDTDTGVLKFKMGTDAGGGRVSVSACGQTNTLLVYNYGKTPVAGVPLAFPQSLPTGKYLMTYSASGDAPIATTSLGYFYLTNLRSFYNTITRAFSYAVNQVSQPGCSQSVGYSPYTDDAFSVTYSVTCTSGNATASEALTFTLTKQ